MENKTLVAETETNEFSGIIVNESSTVAQPAEEPPVDDRLQQYQKALDHLKFILTTDKPRLINVDELYNKFRVTTGFLNALHDLGGIIPDFSYQTEGNELYLKRGKLSKITAAQVSRQSTAPGPKSNLLHEAAKIRDTFDRQQTLVGQQPQIHLPEIPPMPQLLDPFEVTIKSDKGSFTRSIKNMHDVDVLMTYLRVQTVPEPLPLRQG